jgi:broad specificity phosphatase PhoE
MKQIYLVRHGESQGNVGTHYQEESTPLTENGRKQAAFVAERTKKLPIEAIIASTMVRAQQTAAIIAEGTDLPVESSSLFIERRRPTEQIANLKESPEAVDAEAGIIQSGGLSGFRYSDEENFDDLKERAGEALAFLENHPKDSLLVVTHGVFVRNLVARAIFGENLTGSECSAILDAFVASNTGITVLQFDPEKRVRWSLLTWNDHAHLG